MSDRHAVLRELVEFAKPIEELRDLLGAFEWDFEGDPLIMTGAHIRGVIERYIKGDLSAQHVEDWANLIEGREDIDFSLSEAETLRDIVHELANPMLTHELSLQRAKAILVLLSKPA